MVSFCWFRIYNKINNESGHTKYNVNVICKKDEDGYYVYCLQLKDCQSQGNTFEVACNNIQEAIELYLETVSPEEASQLLNHEVITSTIETALA